ncbi:2-hydroxyacid dehydrogenase [Kiloniella sp.]|uniref:2-hydroxyacid dehydrogenase n=1 Tax=Kiloniella sp. TaxID=1938587 RepID=UPI003B01D1C8
MSILLLTSVPSEEETMWLNSLRASLPEEDIVLQDQVRDKEAVDLAIVANPPQGVLSTLPNLKWIQSLWAGVDALLDDPTLPENSPLVRLIDPTLARSMAESVATYTLMLHRKFPLYVSQQSETNWKQHDMPLAVDRQVGILGLGEMGRASAQLLSQLGFNVRGWSRSLKNVEGVECFSGQQGLSDFLKGLDVVVNLLPLTSETRGILSRSLFEQLPKGAGLLNFGRGGHQVEGDVINALDSGQLSHAVLDVFSQEPLPKDNPLWQHPNITLLPHVAAPTNPGTAVQIVTENVRSFRATEVMPKTVERTAGY